MRSILIFSLFVTLTSTALAGRRADKNSIKKMAGCYKVTFENAETFAIDPEYTEYYERFKSGGLEWIFVDEESRNRISLQHLLIVAPKTIVKHWRQEWNFRDTSLFTFEGDRFFRYREMKRQKNQWTQAVYQVDDSPRYECSAPWIRWSSGESKKEYWECESNAPLPRREFSVRDDYNILKRANRHDIVDIGHIHSHDGKKILREAGIDKILVEEKGKNTYRKVDDALCNDAIQWWKDHERYWRDVRVVWHKIFREKKDLHFLGKVEEKLLWQVLFELDEKMVQSENYDPLVVQNIVEAEIRKFLK